MNNRLALLICVLLAFHMGACTSNDSRDDEAAAEESMGGDESLEDVEGLDAEGGGEVADDSSSDASFEEAPADASGDATADAGAAAGGDEEGFSEDALSDDGSATAAAPPADGAAPADGGFAESDMSTDPAFADTAPPADAGADTAQVTETPPSSEPPPPMDNSPGISDSGSSSSASSGGGGGGGRSYPVIPLKKIEAAPFERDGVLLNAVYFARPGDTFSKVAKMIYSDGKKTKQLKNINPDTMPRVGDPIYYNSPNRPTDNTAMKVYYDDAGVQPKVYMANEGDDLKKVSKQLLGFDGAWKEVWASNSVESKAKVPAGTEIRYYSDGETAPAVIAKNDAPVPAAPDQGMPPVDSGMPPDQGMPPAPDAGMPPQDMGMPQDQMADAPPPPPDNMLPPPDAPADAGMAGMNDLPPPDMAPPPPPPPPPPPENSAVAARPDLAADGSDNDMLMALGAAGGIAVLLAVLMIMRRRRQQREMAAAFGDTQVGT